MVICLEVGADLHMAQLMLLPLTFSCFSKIQIGSTFLVPAHLGSPGKRAIKQVCVCVYIYILAMKIASPGNQRCANCIDTLSFPISACSALTLLVGHQEKHPASKN